MKIYLNEKELNLKLKTEKIGEVLNKITNEIMLDSETIVEIKIDGKSINGIEIPLNEKFEILEMKTQQNIEILIEWLYLLEGYQKNFNILLENTDGLEENEFFDVIELVAFVDWSLNILRYLMQNTGITLTHPDFPEFLENYEKATENIKSYLEEGNLNEAIETIKEMLPLIKKLEKNREIYLKETIAEEKSIRFSN